MTMTTPYAGNLWPPNFIRSARTWTSYLSTIKKTKTPTPRPNMTTFLPGAPAHVVEQVVRLMLRLRPTRKIDMGESVMPATCSARRTGRPYNETILSFTARLMAEMDGICVKHAHEVLTINPDYAAGSLWAAASAAHAAGCRTGQDFERWLSEGLVSFSAYDS